MEGLEFIDSKTAEVKNTSFTTAAICWNLIYDLSSIPQVLYSKGGTFQYSVSKLLVGCSRLRGNRTILLPNILTTTGLLAQ